MRISRIPIVKRISRSLSGSAEYNDISFKVRYVDGTDIPMTTITISEKDIRCPLTPNITLNAMSEILINHSEHDKYRERIFGFEVNGKTMNFVAKHREKRNKILKKIFKRFPDTDTNRAHWETIQSAEGPQVLEMDHHEEVANGDMISDENVTSKTQKLNTMADWNAEREKLQENIEKLQDRVVELEFDLHQERKQFEITERKSFDLEADRMHLEAKKWHLESEVEHFKETQEKSERESVDFLSRATKEKEARRDLEEQVQILESKQRETR